VDRGDATIVGRIFAFLAGLFLLLVGSVMSLGMVLVGAAGMGIATLAQHQRRRHLTRVGGWLAALISVGIVCAVIAFIVTLKVPSNTWSQMKVAMDSASAASAKQPPPAWVERMYPGVSQRAAARRTVFSGKTQSAFLAATFGLMAFMIVGLYGSFGWIVGMLLGYGVRGRWPGATVLPPPSAA
jgi:nitrate reductase NapE component